ncbi:hypothetical protein AB28_4130 [Raoultella ornithinolytica 2-156-04_S1_C2]|nr:hypothetical protein AB00_4133 [Raoultella ornithinolytica 2-156-04_S1_C1]KDX11521.1 hypothetical protein AB28_4130 [Raoultella ornithinolytica 2-156-04_S1_C2]
MLYQHELSGICCLSTLSALSLSSPHISGIAVSILFSLT